MCSLNITQIPSFSANTPLTKLTQMNRANQSLVGETVVVLDIATDPIEAIVKSVCESTGLILEVVIKDKDKLEKIVNVKEKVVIALPLVIRLLMRLLGKL